MASGIWGQVYDNRSRQTSGMEFSQRQTKGSRISSFDKFALQRKQKDCRTWGQRNCGDRECVYPYGSDFSSVTRTFIEETHERAPSLGTSYFVEVFLFFRYLVDDFLVLELLPSMRSMKLEGVVNIRHRL